ncbi:uncharacterized protein CMC5_031140 [Chondromyces crocatus]|uniref:AB hydrolase-1 domain-containing protein n=2 Tax=Chondromyces crocatus TaxID=52 RepID=A0A0K1EE46_CHOCO|nr:uncharacterized protein CMC5_031140 [Chondromyces crocatus]
MVRTGARHWLGVMVSMACVAMGTGCAEDKEEAEPRPTPPLANEPETIAWGACPAFFQTECATVELPLHHDRPDGEKLPVFVARRASGRPDATQLWLLNGGPGGSGADFYEIIDVMAEYLPDFDIYTLDHRGVGQSARLTCPAESAGSPGGAGILATEWEGCFQHLDETWGDGLSAFTTSEAARDLGALIARTRAPEQRAMVWGVSYGTYWALRYLQLFPEQPTAVVLDSVVSPGVQHLSRFDEQYDPVGREVAAACAADPACAARLGDDPWARIETLYEQLDAGHCGLLGLDRPLVRSTLAFLVRGIVSRRAIMPTIHRMLRCNAADQAALGHLYSYLFGEPAEGRGFSQILQNHVSLSELWEVPTPSNETLQARADAALFSPDLGPWFADVNEVWPRYARDEFVDRWPETDVPILMLNGTMDPQTPIETARVAGERLRGPGQTFVAIPRMVHGVLLMPSPASATLSCGAALTFDFLKDPGAAPDTSCVDELPPIDFELSEELSMILFGTEDAWGDGPPQRNDAASRAVGVGAARLDREAISRRLREVRPLGEDLVRRRSLR